MMIVRTLFKTLLVVVLVWQLTGCGTLLYPARRGTESGRLDADIVVLDAIGLLFFVIPGVIAFVVDLATGTIYLPSGETSRIGELLGTADTWDDGVDEEALALIEAAASDAPGADPQLDPATLWIAKAPPGTDVSPILDELMRAALQNDLPATPGQKWRGLSPVAWSKKTRATS